MRASSGTDARRRCRDALSFSREGEREALIIFSTRGWGTQGWQPFPLSLPSPHSQTQRGVEEEEEEEQQQPFFVTRQSGSLLSPPPPRCNHSARRHQTVSDGDAAVGDFHYLLIPTLGIFWKRLQRWQDVRLAWSALPGCRSLFGAWETCGLFEHWLERVLGKGWSSEPRGERRADRVRTCRWGSIRARGLLPPGACLPLAGREGHRLSCLRSVVHNLAKARCGWCKAAPK